MDRLEQPLPDANAWADYFAQRLDKWPILRHSKKALLAWEGSEQEINQHELARTVLGDPLLATKLMVWAQQRRRSGSRELTTINRVLMMMGMRQFFPFVAAQTTVEEYMSDQSKSMAWLMSRIARAKKAAHYAHDWALLRRDIEVEEVSVAALLYELGEILMWLFAPRMMALLLSLRQRFPHHPVELLQRKVFNCSDKELRASLIGALVLPEILKYLMNDEHWENPRTRTVLLAVRWARRTARGWQHPGLVEDVVLIETLVRLNRESLLNRLGVPVELWPKFGVPIPGSTVNQANANATEQVSSDTGSADPAASIANQPGTSDPQNADPTQNARTDQR